MDLLTTLCADLEAEANRSGFAGFGITGAEGLPEEEIRFRDWLAAGNHGSMSYLERNIDKRFYPSLLVPGAQSVIMLAMPYGHSELSESNDSGIALYAWGEDYHTRLRRKGIPLISMLNTYAPEGIHRFFTDTAPLSERSLAVRAGLGWIGKNGTLITKDDGSMVWLSAIVTTIQLPRNASMAVGSCGSCNLCFTACPTGAIAGDGLVDANRCIAYHTNSSREPVPQEIIPKLLGFLFGCDICQEACPHNKIPVGNRKATLASYPADWPATPDCWHNKTEDWFKETFGKSALAETGFDRMQYQAGLL